MVLTRDQEMWGVALWVEKNQGESGPIYIASQIERLAIEGDEAGVAMWRTVAKRFEQLRQVPESDRVS
jgi:hypothetical protein